MRGRIYTDQRCSICGGSFDHDDRGGICFASIIPIRWQQAVFEFNLAGTLESGFLFIGKLKGSLMV